MNPGGSHMSYPGGGGGYPSTGGGYGYGSQYMSAGYPSSVPPGQMSPYGQQGLGPLGAPYGGDPYSKTPPFQQSFQRPYSPTSGFPYQGRQPLQQPMPLSGEDPKSGPIYARQNFPSGEASSPYGYNGFDQSPHHQTSFNSPDLNKNEFSDIQSSQRQFDNFYDKSSKEECPSLDNKPSSSDPVCDEKTVSDELSEQVKVENKNGTSQNEDENGIKSESLNLDSIPFIPDIPDIKTNHEETPSNESDPSSPHPSRGLKRSHSPSLDAQDSESQDSQSQNPSHPMMAGHQETEFVQGINNDSGLSHQYSGHLSYGGQQQMWNYYNNPYNLAHQHPMDQGFQAGMPMPIDNPSMCQNPNDWWMSAEQNRGAQVPGSEYPPGFRMPFNMQAPGPWALRGPRPRGERRGPGRPRLNATTGRPVGTIMERSISAPQMGGRMMSPGLSPYSSGLSSAPGSVPSPDMEGMPSSPSGMGASPEDEMIRKRQHQSSMDMMSASPGGQMGDLPPVAKMGKSSATNSNKKRFTCEICQKRFSTAWYVRVHRKSHNGERPYTCDTCGKGFMLPNVLLTHKKKCERQNPGLASSAPQAPTSLPSNVDPSPPPQIPGIDPDLHHRTSPLPHHPQQQSYGLADPFEREEMSGMLGANMGMGRGGIYPGVQQQPGAQHYNQRFPGPGDSAMGYHMGDQLYGNRDYSSQGYPSMQQPLSPQYSYSPNSGGGGMRPPLGSDNSTSSGGSSLPSGPMVPNPNMQGHFLGNDPPPDKGGGHGGRLVRGELPPVNNVPLNNDPNYYSSCDIGATDPKTSQRPYSCDICDKRFSQKCNLITHKRIHTGEKPHVCPHCDKRFTQKGNLDAHLKTHSKEKPFPCTMCEKKFAHKTSLMSHVRQEHQMFDDIDEFKSSGKYTSPSSPSDFDIDTRSPINHNSFSPGIPTPQSSLDSVVGLPHHNPLMRSDFSPMTPQSHYQPLANHFPPPSPSEMSDISKLTATVEAATGMILPVRSSTASST